MSTAIRILIGIGLFAFGFQLGRAVGRLDPLVAKELRHQIAIQCPPMATITYGAMSWRIAYSTVASTTMSKLSNDGKRIASGGDAAAEDENTVEVLAHHGCEVITPPKQECCGSLHAHNGEWELAQRLARIGVRRPPRHHCMHVLLEGYGIRGREHRAVVIHIRDAKSEDRRVGKECRSRCSPYH